MRLSRRNVLLGAAAGGAASFVGFERRPASGLLTPISARNVAPSSIDAHAILREAIRTRTRITWGGSPALAAPAQDISVITIKVMNHILPALIFRLGQIQGVTDNTVGPLSFSSSASGQQSSGQVRLAGAKDFLLAQGLEQIAPESLAAGRYRKLAFNKWFANILHTGRIEGATVGTSVLPAPVDATDVGDFPTTVAIQAVLGVYQSVPTSNHAFNNCCITGSQDPKKGGDLSFHISEEASNLIPSPLGAVCFNMGAGTETESGSPENAVLRSDASSAAFGAKSVATYVSTIQQATALGLVSLIDDDLVQEFDKLASPPVNFAKELKERKLKILELFDKLKAAADMESTNVTVADKLERGSVQTKNGDATAVARMEFLAQCKFVQAALAIDGVPFRNFNLFCHLSDIDGVPFDTSISGAGNDGLSYVEGMRQLAVGLNMLGKAIDAASAKGQSVYVVVVSEGGRDFSGSDNDVGVSLILGPTGAGALKDRLYAPAAYNQPSNDFVADPGNDTSNFSQVGGKLTGTGLVNQPGSVITNEDGLPSQSNMVATNNQVLIGLIRHLEGRKGIAASSTAGLGRYLKLETG